MKPRTWMLTMTLGLCSAPAFAQVTGTVKFDGTAPEPAQIDMSTTKECADQHPDGVFDESLLVNDGKIQNVVVSIKAAEGKELKGEVPKTPVKLDQKGCQYVPHVAAMMVGQEMVVANSDPFLHNVHSLALDNPAFNFGQPTVDPGKKIEPMKEEERFKIKCDVHPWMAAQISVFKHPYFAITKKDGTFEIPTAGLPDGEYTVLFWQEKFGDKEKDGEKDRAAKVTVKDGKGKVDYTFKAADLAMAAPFNGTTVTVASLTGAKKEPCQACIAAAKAKAETAANAAKVAPAAK